MIILRGILICVPIYSVAALMLGATITTGLFLIHVAVVPLLFKYSKTFRRHLVFANFIQWPLRVDYGQPSSVGLVGCRNLTLQYQSKVDHCPVKIGVWHILPKSVYQRLKEKFEAGTDKEKLNRLLDNEMADSNLPVVMYCHGNSNSRAASHRIKLYKFFQNMDFHTIAFDYRGYGDSTNINPSEHGVVEDSLIVYEWLQNIIDSASKKPPVFVWGHSLGSGIAAHLLGNLKELSESILWRWMSLPLPNGLVLEAPFNNLANEIAQHPLAIIVSWLPYFKRAFVEPFSSSAEHSFRSDVYLRRTPDLPVLILHAQDDFVVPFNVGRKLFQSILHTRCSEDATIRLHKYYISERLGHKWICNARDLPAVVGRFVNEHKHTQQ